MIEPCRTILAVIFIGFFSVLGIATITYLVYLLAPAFKDIKKIARENTPPGGNYRKQVFKQTCIVIGGSLIFIGLFVLWWYNCIRDITD